MGMSHLLRDHLPPKDCGEIQRTAYIGMMNGFSSPQLRRAFDDRDELGDRVARLLIDDNTHPARIVTSVLLFGTPRVPTR